MQPIESPLKHPCRRVFLGWDAPLSSNAAKFVVSDFGSSTSTNQPKLRLSDTVCVLPTTQSARAFVKHLQRVADDAAMKLDSPRVLTVGDLGEVLYEPQRPAAIEFEQSLAWSRALRGMDRERLGAIMPNAPGPERFRFWYEFAESLRLLHSELASEGVGFRDVCSRVTDSAERSRWSALSDLFEAYLHELEAAGLSDFHDQRSRAVNEGRVLSPKRVLLIGTVDVPRSLSMLLRCVTSEITALIAAPESEQSRFDAIGRLVPANMESFRLNLDDEQLVAAGDVADAASRVSEFLDEESRDRPLSTIGVGTTDESLVTPIELQLAASGIATFRHLGWQVRSTAVGMLLDRLSTLIAQPTWKSLAALARHHDVHRAIERSLQNTDGASNGATSTKSSSGSSEDFLTQLDNLLANHFPRLLADPLPEEAEKPFPTAIKVRSIVTTWVETLIGNESGSDHRQPVSVWCANLLEFLGTIYQGLQEQHFGIDRRRTIDAVVKVRDLLTRYTTLTRPLDLKLSATEAMELIVGRCAGLRIGQEPSDDAAPILGWLDLAHSECESLIVCGFNHPYVPEAVPTDPFLTAQLRTALGITDNEHRLARDLYATQLILSNRKRVRFIVGASSVDGSPLQPTRLLGALEPANLSRQIRMLKSKAKRDVESPTGWTASRPDTDLPIPTVAPKACPIDSISVTSLKTYLECPFRFYLRHVLGLRPIDDSANELAANQFGDLVHGALEGFGQSPSERDQGDEKKIFASLRLHLNEYANRFYGDRALSAVKMQIRLAEQRLEFVAAEQARWYREGWRIKEAEAKVDDASGARIQIGDRSLKLKGRFDRIDFRPETGEWAILDYKTHAFTPEKKHLSKNRDTGDEQWVDLQLPLYRRMIPYLGINVPPEDVLLGYFNVSEKREETKVNLANFSEAQMHEADRLIEECAQRILDCDFARSLEPVAFDDYAMILQTGAASQFLDSDSEPEEATA